MVARLTRNDGRGQILAGSLTGLFIAICIGAAFLAVYYTQLDDLYGNSEDLWGPSSHSSSPGISPLICERTFQEGIFNLIAMIMIFIMGLTMLKIDRAKVKWRLKIAAAFEAHGSRAVEGAGGAKKDSWWRTLFSRGGGSDGRQSKYILFFLPFVTVLREGLEAVVFVGGVSLSPRVVERRESSLLSSTGLARPASDGDPDCGNRRPHLRRPRRRVHLRLLVPPQPVHLPGRLDRLPHAHRRRPAREGHLVLYHLPIRQSVRLIRPLRGRARG